MKNLLYHGQILTFVVRRRRRPAGKGTYSGDSLISFYFRSKMRWNLDGSWLRVNGSWQLRVNGSWLMIMTQEERWLIKFNEVKEFIEREHRNPSKFIPEERGLRNWLKANRKAMNAGTIKPNRVEMFRELLSLIEKHKHVNQWV